MKTNLDFKEIDKRASKAFIKKGEIVEHECSLCWGEGEIENDPDNGTVNSFYKCPDCNGKGYYSVEY